MFKKLLTLSLVAVMLSAVALAAPGVSEKVITPIYAAEPESVPFDYNNYEILKVTQTTDTTQTISRLTMGGSNEGVTNKTTRWYLVKVDVGKDWGSFTSIESKFKMTAIKGLNYSYLTSLTKTDYDTAAAAADAETAVGNFLSEPSVVAADTKVMWKDGTDFKSNSSGQPLTLTLAEGLYTYSDGCLYFAFQSTSDNDTYPYAGLRVSETDSFITTVTGKKVEVPVVDDFSDAVIDWNNGTYTVTTATTSGTAMLVVAFFDGTTMVDAEIATVDANDKDQNGVISGTIENLKEGTSVKLFLWDSETLAPLVNSVEKAVTSTPPAAPATWSGVAATEGPSIVDGYYQIETGEDLAWFAAQVNSGNTAYKAKLMNDIYLNWFDDDSNGVFDENWYETAANVEEATSWNDFMIEGFTGEFDGNDNTIYGLYMQGESDTGFFSSVSGGTVKNVTFKGAYLVSTTLTKTNTGYWNSSAGAKAVAIVAATATTENTTSSFERITVYGKITAAETVDTTQYDVLTAAAIVGRITSNVNISYCNSYVDIIDSAKSFPTSSVATESTVKVAKCGTGGIVGYLGSTGSSTVTGNKINITNCVNYGNIVVPYANNSIGGIVGHHREGELTLNDNCGNAGKIRANSIESSRAEIYGKFTDKSSSITGTTELAEFASVGSASVYDPEETIN